MLWHTWRSLAVVEPCSVQAVLLLAVFSVLVAVPAVRAATLSPAVNEVKPYCINLIDDSFLNRCRREFPTGFKTDLADFFYSLFNPVALTYTVFLLVLVVPVVLLRATPLPPNQWYMYLRVMLHIYHWLYRLSYAMCLTIALYFVFHQSRPCACTIDSKGTLRRVGSIFGMPSGDSVAGGLVGAFVIDIGPGPLLLRIPVGLALTMATMLERIVYGLHTVGQATSGGILGIVLHFWSTRAPIAALIPEIIVFGFVAVFAFSFGPHISYAPGDPNNLYEWYASGVVLQLVSAGFVLWHTAVNRKVFSGVAGGRSLLGTNALAPVCALGWGSSITRHLHALRAQEQRLYKDGRGSAPTAWDLGGNSDPALSTGAPGVSAQTSGYQVADAGSHAPAGSDDRLSRGLDMLGKRTSTRSLHVKDRSGVTLPASQGATSGGEDQDSEALCSSVADPSDCAGAADEPGTPLSLNYVLAVGLAGFAVFFGTDSVLQAIF